MVSVTLRGFDNIGCAGEPLYSCCMGVAGNGLLLKHEKCPLCPMFLQTESLDVTMTARLIVTNIAGVTGNIVMNAASEGQEQGVSITHFISRAQKL